MSNFKRANSLQQLIKGKVGQFIYPTNWPSSSIFSSNTYHCSNNSPLPKFINISDNVNSLEDLVNKSSSTPSSLLFSNRSKILDLKEPQIIKPTPIINPPSEEEKTTFAFSKGNSYLTITNSSLISNNHFLSNYDSNKTLFPLIKLGHSTPSLQFTDTTNNYPLQTPDLIDNIEDISSSLSQLETSLSVYLFNFNKNPINSNFFSQIDSSQICLNVPYNYNHLPKVKLVTNNSTSFIPLLKNVSYLNLKDPTLPISSSMVSNLATLFSIFTTSNFLSRSEVFYGLSYFSNLSNKIDQSSLKKLQLVTNYISNNFNDLKNYELNLLVYTFSNLDLSMPSISISDEQFNQFLKNYKTNQISIENLTNFLIRSNSSKLIQNSLEIIDYVLSNKDMVSSLSLMSILPSINFQNQSNTFSSHSISLEKSENEPLFSLFNSIRLTGFNIKNNEFKTIFNNKNSSKKRNLTTVSKFLSINTSKINKIDLMNIFNAYENKDIPNTIFSFLKLFDGKFADFEIEIPNFENVHSLLENLKSVDSLLAANILNLYSQLKLKKEVTIQDIKEEHLIEIIDSHYNSPEFISNFILLFSRLGVSIGSIKENHPKLFSKIFDSIVDSLIKTQNEVVFLYSFENLIKSNFNSSYLSNNQLISLRKKFFSLINNKNQGINYIDVESFDILNYLNNRKTQNKNSLFNNFEYNIYFSLDKYNEYQRSIIERFYNFSHYNKYYFYQDSLPFKYPSLHSFQDRKFLLCLSLFSMDFNLETEDLSTLNSFKHQIFDYQFYNTTFSDIMLRHILKILKYLKARSSYDIKEHNPYSNFDFDSKNFNFSYPYQYLELTNSNFNSKTIEAIKKYYKTSNSFQKFTINSPDNLYNMSFDSPYFSQLENIFDDIISKNMEENLFKEDFNSQYLIRAFYFDPRFKKKLESNAKLFSLFKNYIEKSYLQFIESNSFSYYFDYDSNNFNTILPINTGFIEPNMKFFSNSFKKFFTYYYKSEKNFGKDLIPLEFIFNGISFVYDIDQNPSNFHYKNCLDSFNKISNLIRSNNRYIENNLNITNSSSVRLHEIPEEDIPKKFSSALTTYPIFYIRNNPVLGLNGVLGFSKNEIDVDFLISFNSILPSAATEPALKADMFLDVQTLISKFNLRVNPKTPILNFSYASNNSKHHFGLERLLFKLSSELNSLISSNEIKVSKHSLNIPIFSDKK